MHCLKEVKELWAVIHKFFASGNYLTLNGQKTLLFSNCMCACVCAGDFNREVRDPHLSTDGPRCWPGSHRSLHHWRRDRSSVSQALTGPWSHWLLQGLCVRVCVCMCVLSFVRFAAYCVCVYVCSLLSILSTWVPYSIFLFLSQIRVPFMSICLFQCLCNISSVLFNHSTRSAYWQVGKNM